MRRNGRNGKAGDPSRVLGYVRVSTDEQASNGVSLDEQRRRVSTYTDAEGLSLIDVESDEGISGSKTTNRPALQSALTRLRKGEASGLVVTALELREPGAERQKKLAVGTVRVDRVLDAMSAR